MSEATVIKTTPDKDALLAPPCTFIDGTIVSPYHICCSNDPTNLAPAKNFIVDHVMDLLNKTDKPVVLLACEDHKITSHKVLQQLVMEGFSEKGQKFTYNIEYPDNFVEDGAAERMNTPFPDHITYNALEHDPYGKTALSIALGFYTPRDGPVAHSSVYAFCLQNDIPTRYIDGKRESDYLLDMKDETNRKAAESYTGPKRVFGVEDTDGMAVRNRVMPMHSLAHAAQLGIRLIVVEAGRDHSYGRGKQLEEKDSLRTQFEKAGAYVVTMFPIKRLYDVDQIPKDSRGNLGETIIISDIDDSEYTVYDLKLRPGKEASRFEKLLTRSNSTTSFKNPLDESERKEYQELARQGVDTIINTTKHDTTDQEPPPEPVADTAAPETAPRAAENEQLPPQSQ